MTNSTTNLLAAIENGLPAPKSGLRILPRHEALLNAVADEIDLADDEFEATGLALRTALAYLDEKQSAGFLRDFITEIEEAHRARTSLTDDERAALANPTPKAH